MGQDNGKTDDGYGIRISICPNPEDVIFSWRTFLDRIERNNIEVESDVIKLVFNDSEFFIIQGSYKVIFTHAYEKVQPILENNKVFENCQEVIKYIQYV